MTEEHNEDPIGRKTYLRAYSYKMSRQDPKTTFSQLSVDDTVKSIETNLMTKHGCRFRLSAFRSLGESKRRRDTDKSAHKPPDHEAILKWRSGAEQCTRPPIGGYGLLRRRKLGGVMSPKHDSSDLSPIVDPSQCSRLPSPDTSTQFPQHRVRRSVVFHADEPDVVDVVSREPTIHFGERVTRSDVTRRNRVYPLPGLARRPRPKSILKTGHWLSECNLGIDDNRNEMACTVRQKSDNRLNNTPSCYGHDTVVRGRSSDYVRTTGSGREDRPARNYG